jgi:hypothetical protein
MEPKNILVEPLGSAEPRLKNTGVGIKFFTGNQRFFDNFSRICERGQKKFSSKMSFSLNQF